MKTRFYVAMVMGLALLSSGCMSISYKPSVSLRESPRTIKATVKLETFADQTPQSDKERKVFGVSATEPGTLAGELVNEVTDAVLTDFNNNQVFETVKKRFENEPDLIMKGTIRRFYGKVGPTTLMWITIPIDIIWFFGLPIQGDEGSVDLEVSIQRPNGTVLGTYRGQSQFSASYSMYTNPILGIGTKLNKAFSECIQQIRDQILNDEKKLSRPQGISSVR